MNEIQNKDWVQNELNELNKNQAFGGEKLPSLKFEENKITEFDVDTAKPWEKWIDPADNRVKKIIPATSKGNKYVVWLYVGNPLYRKILESVAKGITHFEVMRTGKQKETRYVLVDRKAGE